MGGSEQTAVDEQRQAPRRAGRAVAAQASRLLGLLTILAVLGLGLVALATGLQSQRDEARRSDLLLVVAPAVPPQAFVDHTFELYRRGYAPRLLVAGDGRRQVLAALRERGLPAEAMVEAEGPALAPEHVAALRAEQGEQASALVVAQPEELLLTMKIARDLGLRAYGSPPPGPGVEPLELLQASADYWRYVLIRR